MKIAVVIPCFNDVESADQLLIELTQCLRGNVSFWLVDDGSYPPIAGLISPNAEINLVTLRGNVGHQRAIVCGLSAVYDSPMRFDTVVVMDSDGEDKPSDVPMLISSLSDAFPLALAVRSKRSEGISFKVGYAVYKLLFRTLVGRTIDFGNFSAMSFDVLHRLLAEPNAWNHYAGALSKMRFPKAKVPTARGERYHGKTNMNLYSLIEHGLAAISVHQESVFIRLVVLGLLISFVIAGFAGDVMWKRFVSYEAIPGWASTMLGLAVLTLLNILLVSASSLLTILNSRSSSRVNPLEEGRKTILTVVKLGQP